MTAQTIGIFTIAFPDPLSAPDNNQFATLASNISFSDPIQGNIQTLSTKDVERGNDPYGILFVPDLQTDDCKNAESALVPANVTRLSNLPSNTEYALVAFAPWFRSDCMKEYFAAARKRPAVKAFLVYQPGDSWSMPPVMNDASWGLGDGGQWKAANDFPTYALAPISGTQIVEQLGQYSGNITDAPYGHDLASMFGPTEYVRLWANVNTSSSSQLPSLWVFLVIVLGLLVIVIGSTSFCMHLMQRRRRNNLRQRVVNGEIDLEAIGVKRLTVPREYLEKLPLYTYSAGPNDQDKTYPKVPDDQDKAYPEVPAQAHNIPSPTIEADTGLKSVPLARHSSAPPIASHNPPPAFSQPTCPICLDDFESNETQVRELPCQHIFHADCIDTFLISNSSLCPMCKKSVLPPGYCPATITNLMVRRERNIRRIRARSARSAANNAPPGSPMQSSTAPTSRVPRAFGSLGSRLGQTTVGRRVFSAPERSQPAPPDIEMSGTNNVSPPAVRSTAGSSTPEITQAASQPTTTECIQPAIPNRREWARQRAMTLLGSGHVPGEGEEEDPTASRWRRGLRRVFPGFR
ncbi:hypothetical protein K504DRAFT_458712 [Pleomassaria siparia CBS 279.74]|uniref:RING-type domain-containing protein n=1 Tax=Pleomassaria siparia CBS 279.74 TaxID=1314801 RepID=A0A6G1K3U0_9PLEO|nr:hypothetical protein K504DRAFT_458712 [Pleomassaria siparia CBS 279.74]